MTVTDQPDRRRLGQGGHADRGAALAEPVPRPDRRDQVRRQRHGRRGAAAGVRAGRRVPALRRPAAGRGARRRPADQRDARPARHRSRVHRRPAGHHAGDHGRRPDGADRPGQPRPRRPDQPARPVRGRACPARTRACSPRRRKRRSSTASRSTSAWSATIVGRRPGRRSRRCSPTAGSRSSPAWPPAADGEVYNVNADTAAAALAVALGAAKLVVLTDVEGLYADWPDRRRGDQRAHRGRARRAAARPVEPGMVPKMEACLRAVRGGVPQAHVLDGRLARRPARDLHRLRGSARWSLPRRSP